VTSFVTENAERFGVEPICRVLTEHGVPIAPSTFYAARSRPPSARAVRDEVVLAEIRRVHADPLIGRGVFGARKVFHALARAGGVEGLHVPRCQVERLMRADGLAGARRGRVFRTTRPDDAAARPPDLVNRDFSAPAPNRLRLVDFTYVPTWAGMAFFAFVTDAYSRRIVGWRTAPSMPTDLPLDALEMALWTRERAGHEVTGVIQHSDAGSQGGFKRSSQHPAQEGCVDGTAGGMDDYEDGAAGDAVAGTTSGSEGRRASVLDQDRRGPQ
jgi:putative transposase